MTYLKRKSSRRVQALSGKLEAFAPRLGRLEADVLTLVERAHNGDHRGVLQQARVVTEGVIHHLYLEADEPGGPLRDKGRYKSLQHIIQHLTHAFPETVKAALAHLSRMGNLGAHDRGRRLGDEPANARDIPSIKTTERALEELAELLSWFIDHHDPQLNAQQGVATSRLTRVRILAPLGAIAVGILGVFLWRGVNTPEAEWLKDATEAYRVLQRAYSVGDMASLGEHVGDKLECYYNEVDFARDRYLEAMLGARNRAHRRYTSVVMEQAHPIKVESARVEFFDVGHDVVDGVRVARSKRVVMRRDASSGLWLLSAEVGMRTKEPCPGWAVPPPPEWFEREE